MKYYEYGCEFYAGFYYFGFLDFDCVVFEFVDDAGFVILEIVYFFIGFVAIVDFLEGVAFGFLVCFNFLKNVIK